MSKPCIGLFGTCGSSKWREKFINRYKTKSINFFNPQKDDWKPEDSAVEAEHLVNDDIVLFPVTGETFGTASLGEIGFSILSAIRANDQRFVVVYVESKLNPLLHQENPTAAKESSNARVIITAHLKKAKYPNVFIVYSLDQMLDVSVKLYEVVETLKEVRTQLSEGEDPIEMARRHAG
jgi:hypothetical protein